MKSRKGTPGVYNYSNANTNLYNEISKFLILKDKFFGNFKINFGVRSFLKYIYRLPMKCKRT